MNSIEILATSLGMTQKEFAQHICSNFYCGDCPRSKLHAALVEYRIKHHGSIAGFDYAEYLMGKSQ